MILAREELHVECKMLIHNGFVGLDVTDVEFNFLQEDSEQDFLDNCKKMPEDWIFRHKKIIYKYNENGHRCKSIVDIDFENYILFAGCSHTVGVGMQLEDTFPYLISKQLNCSYYNLAVGGCGIDVLQHNMSVWLTRYKKPKLLVLQWPDWTRFLWLESNEKNLVPVGSWTNHRRLKEFIILGENSNYFLTRQYLANQLAISFNIPLINVLIGGLKASKHIDSKIVIEVLDRARDLTHYGVETHSNAATRILDQYQLLSDKYSNATINSTTRGQI